MSYCEIDLFGCVWCGDVDYDPGQPYPSFSCGGVPPSYSCLLYTSDAADE